MARKKKVAIEHKKLGLSSEVLEETLPAWELSGWTRVDDGDDVEDQLLLSFDDNATDPDEPGDNEE